MNRTNTRTRLLRIRIRLVFIVVDVAVRIIKTPKIVTGKQLNLFTVVIPRYFHQEK